MEFVPLTCRPEQEAASQLRNIVDFGSRPLNVTTVDATIGKLTVNDTLIVFREPGKAVLWAMPLCRIVGAFTIMGRGAERFVQDRASLADMDTIKGGWGLGEFRSTNEKEYRDLTCKAEPGL